MGYDPCMPKVSLSRALKEKNRQVKRVKVLQDQIRQYNSVVAGSAKPFDVQSKFTEYEAAALKLAALKSAIQIANAPIVPKIHEMAELRGLIAFLGALDTKAGRNVYGFQGELVDYEAAIDAAQAEHMRKRFEDRLDALQDEVDAFNASTEVELPD